MNNLRVCVVKPPFETQSWRIVRMGTLDAYVDALCRGYRLGDMLNPQKQAPMTSREWFVLGIRLFGLWMLTRGVGYVASFTDLTLHHSDLPGGTRPNSYLLYAAFDFAVAGYFLLGARNFAGICDRIHQSDEQEREDEDVG